MQTTFSLQAKPAASPQREKRRGNAGFIEYAGVALDSLRANKLRSGLTLLGIIIGIASIITVISMIEGLDKYWKEKVSNFGPNTFVVTQFPIVTNPDEYFEMVKRNPEVHAADAEAIRRYCTACEAVGVETHKEVKVRRGRNELEQIDLGGATANLIEIEGYNVESGRGISPWEEEHSRFVTFIGWEIADRLFPGEDPYRQEHTDRRPRVHGHRGGRKTRHGVRVLAR